MTQIFAHFIFIEYLRVLLLFTRCSIKINEEKKYLFIILLI